MTFSRPVDTGMVFDRRAVERPAFRRRRRGDERVRLLGADIDLMRSEEVMVLVRESVANGRKALVANHDLRSLNLVRRDSVVRSFFGRADLVEVGSTPLLAWARLLGGSSRALHRGAFVDWRDHFWSLAARQGWRVFYLGGAPGAADRAARALTERWRGLKLGRHDGQFGDAEEAGVLAKIAAFKPDVLLVGMPMPRQEHWIDAHFEALPNCVIVTLGDSLGGGGGLERAVPGWVTKAGVEGLFRLACRPFALIGRYIVEPLMVADLAYADVQAALRRGPSLGSPEAA